MKTVNYIRGKLILKMTGPDIKKELDFVRNLPGAKWNHTTFSWEVPDTKLTENLLRATKWTFIGDAYTEIFKPVEIIPRKPKQIEWDPKQYNFHPSLRHYQIDCIKEIKERHDRCILSLSPGAGKTALTCSWLKTLDSPRVLIVCPSFLKPMWQKELLRWYGDATSIILDGQTPYVLPMKYKIAIINYDVLQYWHPEIKDKFDTIIFDESHFLSNREAIRTKTALDLSRRMTNAVYMSGTPIRSRPLQFFPVLNMVDPKAFNNEPHFKNRYCGAEVAHEAPWQKRFGAGVTYKGASHEDELNWIVNHYMVRKSMDEILPDMPDKNRNIIALSLTDKKMSALNEEAENASDKDKLHKLQALTHSAYYLKRDYIHDLIEEIMESEGKVAIVAFHHDVIDDLVDSFNKVRVIDGRVAPAKRQGIVDEVNAAKEAIIVIQAQAGGVGFSLDTFHNMIFAELVWTPGEIEQLENRQWRMTMTVDKVNYFYPVVAGTVEEHMMNTIDEKSTMASAILDGKAERYFEGSTKVKEKI